MKIRKSSNRLQNGGLPVDVESGWVSGTEFATGWSPLPEGGAHQGCVGQEVRTPSGANGVRNLYTYFGHRSAGSTALSISGAEKSRRRDQLAPKMTQRHAVPRQC
jgi:hypothetical protein